MNNKVKELLNSNDLSAIIKRISHEILESTSSLENIAIIGIKSRGDYIAKRIVKHIQEASSKTILLGTIDVTFHRDDYRSNLGSPKIGVSEINFNLDGMEIVLIDDVLYTGRTIRAALDEIFSYGRPNRIRLGVLVDRGHREIPIKADFVGKNLPTSDNEHIHVSISEVDGADKVFLEKGADS